MSFFMIGNGACFQHVRETKALMQMCLKVRTENINIKKSNRTKFLELHIKTELLQLKQQIKISAEVFW